MSLDDIEDNAGERTRPRVPFSAPRRESSRKMRDDEGAIASTRGRVRSPECGEASVNLSAVIDLTYAVGG